MKKIKEDEKARLLITFQELYIHALRLGISKRNLRTVIIATDKAFDTFLEKEKEK